MKTAMADSRLPAATGEMLSGPATVPPAQGIIDI
jgi:hypothetical protein